MQTLTLAAARALGAVVVLTTLGVTISISYTFGSEQYGDGSPVYGVLWASFAAVAAVCTFSLFGSREARVQLASGIVVALCVLCSGLGSVISLGSRQEQLERAESGREALYANLSLARAALAQIPEHRDTTAIEGEQRLIAEMHRRDPKLKRDTARDLALINELELGRRAAAVKAQIDEVSARIKSDSGPRPTAVVTWLAGKLQAPRQTVGMALIIAFVTTNEAVCALGLYCVFGCLLHAAPLPRRVEPVPVLEKQAPEIALPVLEIQVPAVPEKQAQEALIQDDPVTVFLDEMVVPDADAVTPYNEIDGAWHAWCRERGIDGVAINLGLALRRSGYDAVKMPGSRRTARKGLRIAVRKAA